MAQKFKKVLPLIISNDQNGYIGLNIRQIQDIIDYSEHFNIEGAILFLDFSKSFDSIEWEFMFSLERFGFQESILSWIKTLYTNIKGCINNNVWILEPYTIERGIRQQYPLSALIFITVGEILANRIRKEKQIRGFEIKLSGSNHSIKISQLADDNSFLKIKKWNLYCFKYY